MLTSKTRANSAKLSAFSDLATPIYPQDVLTSVQLEKPGHLEKRTIREDPLYYEICNFLIFLDDFVFNLR